MTPMKPDICLKEENSLSYKDWERDMQELYNTYIDLIWVEKIYAIFIPVKPIFYLKLLNIISFSLQSPKIYVLFQQHQYRTKKRKYLIIPLRPITERL